MLSTKQRLENVKAKWHNLVQVELVQATKTFGHLVLSKRAVWIIVVLIVGLVLHEGRNVFYYVGPLMIKHSHLTVVVINAIIIDYFGTLTSIKLIVAAIEEGVKLVTGGRFPHNMPTLKHIVEPDLLNAAEFRQYLKEVLTSCSNVDKGWLTIQTYTRAQTSSMVCPLLRAATPLGSLGNAINTIGSPFSFDSTPQGNNCEAGDFDEMIASTCLLVNSGAVLLHVVLPIMIAVCLLSAYVRVTLHAAWLGLQTAALLTQIGIETVAGFL